MFYLYHVSSSSSLEAKLAISASVKYTAANWAKLNIMQYIVGQVYS